VELLGPVLVNPILWTAPAFLCGLWSMVFGFGLSTVLTGILASLPLIVAASTLHKAVEMAILLRCSPRVRGGLLGIVSWLGLLMQLGSLPLVTVATPVTRILMWVTGRVGDRWDFTAVRWVLEGWGPNPSLWQAALSATTVGIALTALAGALVAWAIRHGLQGRSADPVEPRAGTTPQRFLLRDPVHRKELLWFRRDAGAWVQTLLVPMTLVLYNLFQMRLLLKGAVGTWHGVCGIATLVGSFFLASLGPKSLASEGSALWIPLTWPIGLERLLETKARFWWMLSLGISGIGFAMAWVRFPEDALPITGRVPDPAAMPADAARRAYIVEALGYMGLMPGVPLGEIAIDRIFIGSCTNARLEDLRAAAAVLRGRKALVPGLVSPGSSLVKRQAEAEGLDRIFIAAGLTWADSGCSMCVGMNGDLVASGERCASTTNRNFRGRQGLGARTHLMSPAMVAAAAVTGRLTDVRDLPPLEG
jgi:hypothetical protein